MSFWQKVIATSFCLLFILVPLVFLPHTSELFEFPKILLAYVLTVAIAGSWIVRMIFEKRWIFKRTFLDWPIFIFLSINLLSLLFSIDIHTSFYGYYSRWNGGWLSLLSYALLYWAFVSNMDRKSAIISLQCSIFSAAVVAAYGSLEHFGFSPSCLLTRGSFGVDCWVQDVKTRVFATLGQPNWMAAYLAVLIWIPVSILNTKIEFKNLKQAGNVLIFVVLFAALLFTKSRSGLMAFGLSTVVYWTLLFKTHKSKVANLFVAFTLGITVFGLLIPNPLRDLVIRSSSPAPVGPVLEVGGTESGEIRKIVWTGAVRIWQGNFKNLLIGTGPETFAMAYYQYRPAEHNQTSEWELLYNKAHNEFLNYLATTGLLGLVSYLVLLAVMARQLLENKPDTGHRILKIALLAGWTSLPVTNFWGFSTVIAQLLLFLLPAIAMALDIKPESHRSGQLTNGQMFATFLILIAAGYVLYLTARYFIADIKYAAGLNYIKSFQATTEPAYLISAYQDYSRAFSLNTSEPVITSELSVAAAYLANSLRESDATSAGQLAQISIAASDKAIAISPRHPNHYKSRARTMILLSDLDHRYLTLAAEALEKAAEISPTDPRIPHNLGVVYHYMSATDSAVLQFQKALELKPDFVDSKTQLEEILRTQE